jgi:plasmid stability protein
MFKPIFAALGLCACALLPAHAGNPQIARDDDPAVITEWNTIAEGVIPASAGVTLPRTYAMMHIAMFDAVNSIDGRYTAYRVRVPAWHGASREAAAAQAAHDVLTALLPAGSAKYDAALAARLANLHPGRAQLGAQVGREVAQKILEWRSNDGWSTPQTFTPPALPGVWQPTPPAFAAAGFVQAADARPFGLPTP